MIFPAFWFDCNECWGLVHDEESYEKIIGTLQRLRQISHDEAVHFLRAAKCTRNKQTSAGYLTFGYRLEHSSEYTLDEYMISHGF